MDKVLLKREDENDFEYKVRLCVNKLDRIEPYSSLDWQDIVDLLELDCHRDSLRKGAYLLKEYHNYIQEKGIENISQEFKEELNKKILELKKEQVKNNDLRSEINKQVRIQSRFEQLLDMFAAKIDELSMVKPFINVQLPTFNDEFIKREGVLCLSDLHYGQDIDNYLNTYNSDIFKKRLEYLTTRTIEIAELHNLHKVHLFILGDLVSGTIHNSIRLTNRESITTQILDISEALSEVAYVLAQHIPVVSISIADGNHDRIFDSKENNTPNDNYCNLIREFIKLRTKSIPNVVFLDNQYDNSIVTLKVCDRWIIGSHGDKDKPASAIQRYTSLLKIIPETVILGHYHHCMEDSFGETDLVVNGSFSGTDYYSASLRLHSKPTQKLLIYSTEHGREATYNITLK